MYAVEVSDPSPSSGQAIPDDNMAVKAHQQILNKLLNEI
jgi:hypothetical protein